MIALDASIMANVEPFIVAGFGSAVLMWGGCALWNELHDKDIKRMNRRQNKVR